jgi:hypothetical protein
MSYAIEMNAGGYDQKALGGKHEKKEKREKKGKNEEMGRSWKKQDYFFPTSRKQ